MLRRNCPDDFEPNEALLDWLEECHPSVDAREATRKLKRTEFDPPRDDWNEAWREVVRGLDR